MIFWIMWWEINMTQQGFPEWELKAKGNFLLGESNRVELYNEYVEKKEKMCQGMIIFYKFLKIEEFW